jgi:protein ImuA
MLARRARIERAKAHLERIAPHRKDLREFSTALLALAEGKLHEIRVEDWRDRPSAISFALALAGRRPCGAIVFLQLLHEARAEGALFARGLSFLGVDPMRVVSLFARDEPHFLWAVEEAAREKSVAAVIALAPKGAGKALDLTATRRLSLAAEEAGASPILIRTIKHAEPTAAFIRWRIEPAPSRPDADDEKAAGALRWRVLLERFRADGRFCAGAPMLVELSHDGEHPALAEVPAVSVPLSPILGHGAFQAQPSGGRSERRAARSL